MLVHLHSRFDTELLFSGEKTDDPFSRRGNFPVEDGFIDTISRNSDDSSNEQFGRAELVQVNEIYSQEFGERQVLDDHPYNVSEEEDSNVLDNRKMNASPAHHVSSTQVTEPQGNISIAFHNFTLN